MIKIESRWLDIRQLDEMAAYSTIIHRIHPCAKVLTTVIFLLVVASFSKYQISGLFPLFFYPMVIILLGEIPIRTIARRVVLAVPFVILLGMFNPLFDKTPLMQAGPFLISGGWISFASLLLRFLLAVTAALLLVGTTGINGIGMALLRFKVPHVIVMQLLFLYRYLYVLVEEFIRTIRAHSLRSCKNETIGYRVWGSLLGQLLLRTVDRAQRIYQAMLCRGFDGEVRLVRQYKLINIDIVYIVGWSVFFIIVRFINIPQWLGTIVIGGQG